MGIVYKARQLGLNRVVALKMIVTGDSADVEETARFRTEAEALARCQHANIVQIYEITEQSGQPCLSLEFVDGGNLARQIAGKPQAVRKSARLVQTLARAVQVAHDRGIIHRDLNRPTSC
jgi:serine/threonine protein kinase